MGEIFDPALWTANPVAIGPLVTFVSCVTMAALFWTNRRRIRGRGRGFIGISFTTGFWAFWLALCVCYPHDTALSRTLNKLGLSVITITGPFGLLFIFDFTRVRRARVWLGLSLFATVAAIAMIAFDPEVVAGLRIPAWGGSYPVAGDRFLLSISGLFVSVVAMLVLSWREWRRLPPSRRRRQMGYVTLAFGIALFAAFDIVGAIGYDLLPVGWLSSLTTNAIVYYAVVRHRLLDIRTALHRTVYLVLEGAAVFAPLYLLARATEAWGGWGEPASRAVAVAGTLVLLRLYAVRTTAALEAFLDRRRRARAEELERFTARAATISRPEELFAPLAEAVSGSGLELVAVAYAVDTGEGTPRYQVLPAGAPPAPLSPEGPLPDEARTRAELDPEAHGAEAFELSPFEAQLLAADRVVGRWLDGYRADVLLPLKIGAVLLRFSPPRPALTLDEGTRAHLGRIAARAQVELTNATLREDLDRRAGTLGHVVEERTSALAGAVRELKARQAALVQAEKQTSLGLVVAGVSHEINNALNFIYGNLPTLEKYARAYDELIERVRAAGGAIEEQAELDAARRELSAATAAVGEAARGARGIVDDLRRFARHDEAEHKAADVREGLDSTLNLLRNVLAERIVVERRYQEVPPVECFPAALNHVFLNVLLNAVQAIGGQGKLTIDVRGDDGAVLVEIADSGAGVAEAERERVFEAFTSTRGAAGLGLTVSRQIVERHGGTISIGSSEGGGAAVRIRIPRGVVP